MNGRLLDVGCGLGYLIEALGNHFVCVGIDYDIKALRVNKRRGQKNMIQANLSEPPFKEKSFDVIICSEVLEHLPDGIDHKALLEMARLLKPGGRILVTVPALEGVRSASVLRNLGHGNRRGGEYHYRSGYSLQDMEGIVGLIPGLSIIKKRFAMFFASELFMDILKWTYFKKHKLKQHSDMISLKDSFLFRIYRLLFPLIYFIFICEDLLLASFLKGHILIMALERKEG